MRYLTCLVFVLALAVIGCSETAGTGSSGGTAGDGGSAGGGGTAGDGGTGGSAGSGGTAGDGGSGGAGGTAGSGGTGGTVALCHDKVCQCTEGGIYAAITEGGGPYTFTCDGPTTVVTGGEVSINKDVVLDGEGNLILDGNETHPVFHVWYGVTVDLHGFTVTRGATQGNGGGIWNEGALTITNSTITDSTALCEGSCRYQGFGGGIYNDNYGTLTMVNSTVSNNIAREWGGGIFGSGTVTLTNSTVSGNTAKNGSGICSFTATLRNSTVSGNTSTNGSDICNGSVALTNSLVDGDCEGILPLPPTATTSRAPAAVAASTK